MKLNNFTLIINQSLYQVLKKIRKIYLNSSIYDRSISSKNLKALTYKPSLKILGSIVKYEKTKNKIEDFETDKIWEVNKLSYKDYKKLNNFFWLFSVDLKSSKKICISIINKWIESNQKYNDNLWEIDTLSRRIISWITNSQLTYDEGDKIYKEKFNKIIFKQINNIYASIITYRKGIKQHRIVQKTQYIVRIWLRQIIITSYDHLIESKAKSQYLQ